MLLTALTAAVFVPASIWAQGPGVRVIGAAGTLSAPGHYVMNSDIRISSSSGVGIRIASDGVTLDLNGHGIMGNGGKLGTGIMIDGVDGVEVFNGSTTRLAFGIVVHNSNNVVLRDLRIRSEGLPIVALPPETAIMIVHSKNVVVRDNAIFNTGLGIFVRGGRSGGNRIEDNTLTAGTNGVLGICYNPADDDPNGPRGDLVQNNFISGFGLGIQASEGAFHNVFRGNTIAFREMAMELVSDTNQDIDNVAVPLM